MTQVFAFEVTVVGKPEWGRVINHFTAGKAKYEYWRDVSESWEVPYTALRVRKLGSIQTPSKFYGEQFQRVADKRGLPNARIGDRVKVEGSHGTIVGYNDSCNFDVLFDLDAPKSAAGLVLNCHPATVEFL